MCYCTFKTNLRPSESFLVKVILFIQSIHSSLSLKGLNYVTSTEGFYCQKCTTFKNKLKKKNREKNVHTKWKGHIQNHVEVSMNVWLLDGITTLKRISLGDTDKTLSLSICNFTLWNQYIPWYSELSGKSNQQFCLILSV